jgi:adenylate cyclase
LSSRWQISVYENQELVFTEEVEGPIWLGRQAHLRERAYSLSERDDPDGGERKMRGVVISPREDQNISRWHAWIEPLSGNRVRVTNKSKAQSIGLLHDSTLFPEKSCELTLPVLLTLGSKTVRLQEVTREERPFESLAEATRAPGQGPDLSVSLAALSTAAATPVGIESLFRWFQGALDVLAAAAGGSDFFFKAARAAVDLVGLDTGWVLLCKNGRFQPQTVQTAAGVHLDPAWQPSRQVLDHVRQQKRTFWQVAAPDGSLVGITAVVAAPILDREQRVIGALYGDRRPHRGASGLRPITRVEALLVELLAVGIAAGLARVEQEQAALRATVQFEQFFTKELSLQLAAQPDLLQGRDAEVTLLFADVHGFSRISHHLGPTRTMEWIGDVLGALSESVLAHQGVVVDYIGDEVIAMWGAPAKQPGHANLACRAALDMLARLPGLNQRWQPVLGEPTSLGIGINTGTARVGNTGTQRKFKYGPLGDPVNLASRVQGATKYLKCNLLITQATQAALDPTLPTRRLCRVRMVNINDPVELYELAPPDQPGWADLKAEYEKALAAFEQQQFRLAARTLAPLVAEDINDGPSLVLMSRAVACMVEESEEFDPVWVLPNK